MNKIISKPLKLSNILGITGSILLISSPVLNWFAIFPFALSGFAFFGVEQILLVIAGGISFIFGVAGIKRKENFTVIYAVSGFAGIVYMIFAYIRIYIHFRKYLLTSRVFYGIGFWFCISGAIILIIAWVIGRQIDKAEESKTDIAISKSVSHPLNKG